MIVEFSIILCEFMRATRACFMHATELLTYRGEWAMANGSWVMAVKVSNLRKFCAVVGVLSALASPVQAACASLSDDPSDLGGPKVFELLKVPAKAAALRTAAQRFASAGADAIAAVQSSLSRATGPQRAVIAEGFALAATSCRSQEDVVRRINEFVRATTYSEFKRAFASSLHENDAPLRTSLGEPTVAAGATDTSAAQFLAEPKKMRRTPWSALPLPGDVDHDLSN